MRESREATLVARYRRYYRIPDDVMMSEEMVCRHWELERELTSRLVSSTPEERWTVFEDCYTRLYSELPWLNQSIDLVDQASDTERFRSWVDLLGAPPKSVYEVGSGRGEMMRYLVSLGFRGKATEITRERGASLADESDIEWGVTDGVHLDRFENSGSWDFVVSDQVLEHLHPDDLVCHLRSARAILDVDGAYILRVPHRYLGPSDVSALFGADVACGMHLREYTYSEMARALTASGYSQVTAVFLLPQRVCRALRLRTAARGSSTYLHYAVLVESIVGLVPSHRVRRATMRFARLLLGPNSVWMIAER